MFWFIRFIIWILVGIFSGWAASRLMNTDNPYGRVGDFILGIIGAFVGGILFGILGFETDNIIGSTITSIVGAVVFIWLLRKLKK